MRKKQKKQKYVVKLSKAEQEQLKKAFRGGRISVLELRRMRILLMSDINGPALSDGRIAEDLSCSLQTVLNVRRNFVQRGFSGAISRKQQAMPSRRRRLDGHGEARLIALACGKAPEGFSRWTVRLLTDRAVELEIAEDLSRETVRRVLKKTNLSLT